MRLSTLQIISKAKEIRKTILRAVCDAQASHVGSALSCADILSVLYFNVLKIDPKSPKSLLRDRLILSKGHAGIGLLSTLAQRGFFPVSKLKNYCRDGSTLTGHTMIESAPGVEATTGSLGHGLPIGVGMALASKIDSLGFRVFVILSEGELDEGSNWEAILSAAHLKLSSLVAVVDYNKIQSFGRTREVMDLEPLVKKWTDFGWNVSEVDGHDIGALVQTFKSISKSNKPSCIIAHTIKGKGVSYMEDKLEWHYKSPDIKQLKQALQELK